MTIVRVEDDKHNIIYFISILFILSLELEISMISYITVTNYYIARLDIIHWLQVT